MLVRKCVAQSPRAERNIEGGGATATVQHFKLVLREVVRNLDYQFPIISHSVGAGDASDG